MTGATSNRDGASASRSAIEPIPSPIEPDAIILGTGVADTSLPAESWFSLNGKATVRNVRVASLTPVLPTTSATGAAVVIAPGGGYLMQSVENEGWPQARWLADRGIAAFVLKYRLLPSPEGFEAFGAALRERFAAAVVAPGERRKIDTPAMAVADGEAAIRLMRARAAEWRIDPARIGFLGFSAGAMIGLGVVSAAMPDSAPDFLATVYPSMDPVEVAPDAPPLFVVIAADDQLYGTQGYGLAESWRRASRPVELHVYEKGGHGFGMGLPGTTSVGMMEAFHTWLRCGGWLASTPALLDEERT